MPVSDSFDSFYADPALKPPMKSVSLRTVIEHESTLSLAFATGYTSPTPIRCSSIEDSSGDEGSAPLLSAEAEEILGVGLARSHVGSSTRSGEGWRAESFSSRNTGIIKRESAGPSPVRWHEQMASPVGSIRIRRRVVRLNADSIDPAKQRMSRSSSDAVGNSFEPQTNTRACTPGVAPDLLMATGRPTSLDRGSLHSKGSPLGEYASTCTNSRMLAVSPGTNLENVCQTGTLTVSQSKAEDIGLTGSLRIKRVGKVTGRYLSGPARRGLVRKQSKEDYLPLNKEENDLMNQPPPADDEETSKQQGFVSPSSQASAGKVTKMSHRKSPIHNEQHIGPTECDQECKLHSLVDVNIEGPVTTNLPVPKRTPSFKNLTASTLDPLFIVRPLPASLSKFDEENEPSPTFRRKKSNVLNPLENSDKMPEQAERRISSDVPAALSLPRKALAPRSQNVPSRPAPPPPKMAVLETVTATNRAVPTSQSRKKRNYVSVNGKLFTRMDCIGKGGSAKVYRVMAENYKIFALKRVSLEDVDEMAIRGYKGEIELLRKLQDVNRVIRLFDWEINDARQTLSILMEIGESDLNRLLMLRLNAYDANFDISFTRYFWKEMLECVQAIHTFNIVHSDLKPANFLLVQGGLKLIDFGIANSIQDDTVNVHREQTIGTPNYMSPETLIDANAKNGLPSTVGKLMKLGKPSDVWSLGCILYQMVYGKPPFAQITHPMQKVVAITNPRHAINFPICGLGGKPLPGGLIRTLRSCLRRDSAKRPRIDQLLVDGDPLLHPESLTRTSVRDDLVVRFQQHITEQIRENGMPTKEELSAWPATFLASVNADVEEDPEE